MTIRFVAMPTEEVVALQQDGPDAHGQTPERQISDGDGVPCRHCLTRVAKGEPYLVLAYRPFPGDQPYAETGPIFLHAEPCPRFEDGDAVPEILTERPEFVMRGYDRARPHRLRELRSRAGRPHQGGCRAAARSAARGIPSRPRARLDLLSVPGRARARFSAKRGGTPCSCGRRALVPPPSLARTADASRPPSSVESRQTLVVLDLVVLERAADRH